MSQKPFDLPKALAGLKTVSPAHTPTLDELASPRPRTLPYRFIAVGLAAALGVIVFWPRTGSGLAWAQVTESMQKNDCYHLKMSGPGNVLYSEMWVDGNRYAYVLGNKNKEIVSEGRCDGSFVVRARPMTKPRNGGPIEAFRTKVEPGGGKFVFGAVLGSGSNIIDEILRNKEFKALEQKDVQTAHGPRVRYKLISASAKTANGATEWISREMLVYVDPETKLVRRTEILDAKGGLYSYTDVEYPGRIDDSIFKFNRPGIRIRNLDADRKRVSEMVQTGLGSQTVKGHKVTLRAVLYDNSGGLWVLWTGGLPRGDLKHLVRVVGQPVPKVLKRSYPNAGAQVNAFGLKAFTANATPEDRPSKRIPGLDARIGGMALGLRDKTFQKIDVIVPVLDTTGSTKFGEATFKGVPVFRIDSIYNYGKELGLR